jgi:NAD(P)-dependent dehydrogenase (short-subunit alcohol dehydrogenase family)
MSLFGMLKPNGPNGFGYGSTAEDVTAGVSLAGKTVLVTGCNSGLGLETIRVLRMRGADVIGTARTVEKAEAAGATTSGPGSFRGLACELSDAASIRGCVDAVRGLGTELDVIVANAGIMALPKLEQAYGWELQFFTNHIGHFMLVTGILGELAPDGRVVITSSDAHKAAPRGGIAFDNLRGERSYAPWKFYGQSKIANILFAKELARRFAGTKQTANALHPGVIQTNLGRSMLGPVTNFIYGLGTPLMMKNIAEGAATQCFLAAHPDGARHNGDYFKDCNPGEPRAEALDVELAKKLWAKSEEIVAALP